MAKVPNLQIEFEKLVVEKKRLALSRFVEALREATPVDTGHARDSWRTDGSKIYNDADYIQHLNEGSSEQAPSHFIEKTLLAQKGVNPDGIIVRSQ